MSVSDCKRGREHDFDEHVSSNRARESRAIEKGRVKQQRKGEQSNKADHSSRTQLPSPQQSSSAAKQQSDGIQKARKVGV